MAGTKSIVDGLFPLRESRQATPLAQCVDARSPPCQDFVRLALVGDVPADFVTRGVKNVVKCYGQLNHAQAGTEMSSCDRDGIQHLPPNFVGKLLELRHAHAPDPLGALVSKRVQQWCGLRWEVAFLGLLGLGCGLFGSHPQSSGSRSPTLWAEQRIILHENVATFGADFRCTFHSVIAYRGLGHGQHGSRFASLGPFPHSSCGQRHRNRQASFQVC
mmetsp:Transcript_73085/g.171409  ORF Transcript_73085/g.171409 Transcript_73085/m.171409 type:complete len:217 (+) Transcript_73085:1941-2591(+)